MNKKEKQIALELKEKKIAIKKLLARDNIQYFCFESGKFDFPKQTKIFKMKFGNSPIPLEFVKVWDSDFNDHNILLKCKVGLNVFQGINL